MSARDQGFTVLEALVAFTLLAVVFVAVFGLFGENMFALNRASENNDAVVAARSLLESIGSEDVAKLGVREGAIENSPYRWRITVTNADGSAPGQDASTENSYPTPLRLRSVQVELSWSEDGRDHVVRLETRRIARGSGSEP